ncbi:MAG: serpin family protein [Bacteroidetes bacterium]|jgi:serpin B|nr:serpin family protein [Bacteroidota bacterium]
MKSIVSFATLTIFLFLSFSCSEKTKDDDENRKILTDQVEVKSALVNSNNEFAFEFFANLLEDENEETNTFISPLSVYYALAMAYNGADGATKDAFIATLQWNNLSEEVVLQSLLDLYNQLVETPSGVTLEIANSMWSKEGFEVKQSFIDVNQEYLNAEVQSLDFYDPQSVDIINNWIEDQTNDMIQDMLTSIHPDAVLYLINAIYFNGLWKYQFADTSNYEGDFRLSNGSSKTVTYMKQQEDFNYMQNDLFSAVQLPYNDTNFYMMVMLPNEEVSANEVARELTIVNWDNWQNDFTTREVELSLPKFSFSYGIKELKEVLADMGLAPAFSDGANFSEMGEGRLKINSVKHKARVEVNEEGTEAAAVTVIEIIITSGGGSSKIRFQVNKPFLFAICEKQSNAIVFMGKVVEPVID